LCPADSKTIDEVDTLNARYSTLSPQDVKMRGTDHEFALDILIGLSKKRKSIPCRYIYDKEGNELFRQITEIPEYYLTTCEYDIFQACKDDIVESIDKDRFNVVELGAGDGKKTRVLLEHFLERGVDITYIPIDISEAAMKNLINQFTKDPIDVTIEGIVAEYSEGLKWLSQADGERNLVLFLGSNIGNAHENEAQAFLHKLRGVLNPGDYLLIGFDLKKDIEILNKAYNDSENITAQFHLNLLRRINHELGGNFNPDQFKYYGSYNVLSGAIESYLVSLNDQTVHVDVLNQSFSFKEWEPVHTEYSFKYSESDVTKLAEKTGFEIIQNYTDSKKYFLDSPWRVKKNATEKFKRTKFL